MSFTLKIHLIMNVSLDYPSTNYGASFTNVEGLDHFIKGSIWIKIM